MQSWNVKITQLLGKWTGDACLWLRGVMPSTLTVTQLMIILTDGRRRRPPGRRRRRLVAAGAEWRRPVVEDQQHQTLRARLQHRPWSTTDSDSSRYRASRRREADSSATADLCNKRAKRSWLTLRSVCFLTLLTGKMKLTRDSHESLIPSRPAFPPSPPGSECTVSYERVGATLGSKYRT